MPIAIDIVKGEVNQYSKGFQGSAAIDIVQGSVNQCVYWEYVGLSMQ